ncbi:hypothetical protein P170DRAFT_163248 [Aspergillus steynii IBT 23096]|uniref:Uncharacterized protein n=1 Tax=Aspergillus steynii IBT 23096 TaxID=1392250 RepID=A0A2I2GEE3_9EURO|nr:uncharacterized protein P170DRAFT_163248 [Aspergillus steynii IBT 23096]PLB51254.1 hypothetical protein P170DRAFT_163248 [Aspergillus steynii IBT 23096]
MGPGYFAVFTICFPACYPILIPEIVLFHLLSSSPLPVSSPFLCLVQTKRCFTVMMYAFSYLILPFCLLHEDLPWRYTYLNRFVYNVAVVECQIFRLIR